VLVPLVWYGNPAVALLVGIVLTLVIGGGWLTGAQRWGRVSLQSAIVLLGFSLTIGRVAELSGDAVLPVAVYVLSVLGVGALLGRLFGLDRNSTWLMAAGTAICGGTAIATLAPILKARADQVGIAIAIVFLLNAAAIFAFPVIGRALGLSQVEFGTWVALAVHDTSSVLATAAQYGDEALEVATTVKLGRTLWLIPLALAMGLYVREPSAKVRVPTFILAFLVASLVGTVFELPEMATRATGTTSRALLVVALFCIGTEITRATLRQLRGRVLGHALSLWALAVAATLGFTLA